MGLGGRGGELVQSYIQSYTLHYSFFCYSFFYYSVFYYNCVSFESSPSPLGGGIFFLLPYKGFSTLSPLKTQ